MDAGFKPRIAQLAPRITTTLGLVAAGMGIALVPESMRTMMLNGVVYRPLKGAVRQRVVLGLASRRHDPSATVKRFIACVRGAVK